MEFETGIASPMTLSSQKAAFILEFLKQMRHFIAVHTHGVYASLISDSFDKYVNKHMLDIEC